LLSNGDVRLLANRGQVLNDAEGRPARAIRATITYITVSQSIL